MAKHIPHSENSELVLRSIGFSEKEGRNGWQAIDLKFRTFDSRIFQSRIFGPKTPKERVKVNQVLRHLADVLGVNYEAIPYQESFEDFVYKFIKEVEGFYGTTLYVKTLPKFYNGKMITRLAFNPPLFSLYADLEYDEDERIYLRSVTEEEEDYEPPVRSIDLTDEEEEYEPPF